MQLVREAKPVKHFLDRAWDIKAKITQNIKDTKLSDGLNAAAGSTQCNNCPAGQASDARSKDCSLCPAGTSAKNGSSKCVECEAGTATSSG